MTNPTVSPVQETGTSTTGLKLWSLLLHVAGIAGGVWLGVITFHAITR